MNIFEAKLSEITPFAHNPRRNEPAVDKVAESIEKFGFNVPIIVDRQMVIIAGHTRLKALKDLGAESVECIVISHLTEEEEKAFRIADNRAAEFAQWDSDLLVSEMKEINADDWEKYGFKGNDIKKLLPPEMCKCPKCGKSFYKA